MAEYCRLCAQTEVNEQTIENHIKFNIKQSIDVDCSENYFKNNYKKRFPILHLTAVFLPFQIFIFTNKIPKYFKLLQVILYIEI